ncbi:MAG: AMP-binding protein [Alphaproteobacteria bacterium]|nr:AMP-binding protein [Alphaproteobacteria bacterium]
MRDRRRRARRRPAFLLDAAGAASSNRRRSRGGEDGGAGMTKDQAAAATRDKALFLPPSLRIEALAEGVIALASGYDLPAALEPMTARLDRWARSAPSRVCIAERSGAGWRCLGYAAAVRSSKAIAAALLDRGLSQSAPLAILGEASIAQAELRFAALRAGIPFLPLSPGLLRHGGPARLEALLSWVAPGLVAVSPRLAEAWGRTRMTACGHATLVMDEAGLAPLRGGNEATALARAEAAVHPDTLAAVFFTSGSTGSAKGVEVTQRMLAANQAGYEIVWPFLRHRPPVLLDWLPWHHTFGGNDNLFKAVWNGGSYYIDDGEPTPAGVARSLAWLDDEVAPTIHLNVPKGLAALADRLERDDGLFARFFARLDVIFFAGAALDEALWRRLVALVARARAATGREIGLVSGYGATEAGSTICVVHAPIDRPSAVGLPLPGMAARLVPSGDKLEMRIKGPAVTPGYWRDPAATRAAFDAEGFWRSGDAVRFLDEQAPERGLVFDGRIAEDFKLASGSWVSVGPLRQKLLLALAPLVRDVVITGEGGAAPGAILFLDAAACRAALGVESPLPTLAADRRLRTRLIAVLAAHNRANPGSSTALARFAIAPDEPSPAAGEVSDKGSLNQRACRARRAALVAALHAPQVAGDVIDLEHPAREASP